MDGIHMVAEKGIPDSGKYVGAPSDLRQTAVGAPFVRRRAVYTHERLCVCKSGVTHVYTANYLLTHGLSL